MRLNYTTYPIWKQIEAGSITSIDQTLLELTRQIGDMQKFIGAMQIAGLTAVNNNIHYLTKPFRNAIKIAAPKIISSTKDYLTKPLTSGIIMHDGGGTIVFTDKRVEEMKLMLIGFDRKEITAFGTMHLSDYGVGGYGNSEWLKNYSLSDNFSEHQQKCDWFTHILLTYYFINNCEIEIKELKPSQKLKDVGVKYLNESKNTIKIMDCTWFTTLISTIPQHVRGHFRWQPHGQGRLLRKLIWIEEFQRGGFKREAKVLHEVSAQ